MSESAATPGFKSGFVVVIGRPNVGKSTLVNTLVGEKLAPTSPVPQTTRRRLLGILSRDDAQVVFVDTPGVHDPRQRLGQAMVDDVARALEDAELVLAMVDSTRAPGAEDQLVLERTAACKPPRFLVINKIDRESEGPTHAREFESLATFEGTFRISALRGDGLDVLLESIVGMLPEGQPFFPPDQISDVYERDIAGEMVREAALRHLGQELPHAVAVKVEQWKERDNGMLYLNATVYVERESQKGMVIGRGGRMLRKIGSDARAVIEAWLERKVFLDLHVKVLKHWRRDERALRWLGFLPE